MNASHDNKVIRKISDYIHETKNDFNCSIILHEDNFQEKQYLQTLSEKEIKAYEIAKKCLGTSFQLIKSNGYLNWLKENT